jgi:hypothetical protein
VFSLHCRCLPLPLQPLLRKPLAVFPAQMAEGGFAYFRSSDVTLQVKLLVQQLHGSVPAMCASHPPLSYAAWLAGACGVAPHDLHISAQLLVHGMPLGQPERTFSAAGSKLRWNEWLSFTAKYCDLSADAALRISVYGTAGPREPVLIGTATAKLFDAASRLREGELQLALRLVPRFASGDGSSDPAGEEAGEEGRVRSKDEVESEELEAMAARHEASPPSPPPLPAAGLSLPRLLSPPAAGSSALS